MTAVFGNWVHNPEYNTLDLIINGREEYFFQLDYTDPIEEPMTSAELLDRIFQFTQKVWFNEYNSYHLLRAIKYITDPQRTKCSWGVDKTIRKNDDLSIAKDYSKMTVDELESYIYRLQNRS